jgi:hypothetical protein
MTHNTDGVREGGRTDTTADASQAALYHSFIKHYDVIKELLVEVSSNEHAPTSARDALTNHK